MVSPLRPVSRRFPAGRLAAAFAAAFVAAFVGLAGPWTGARDALAESASPAGGAPQGEKPRLPAFDGKTLDGKPLSMSAFAGKRLVLLCFNAGMDESAAFAEAVARVQPDAARNNFAVVGVALGLDPGTARAFVAKHRLSFPVFDDSDGRIAERLGLQSPIMLVGSDGDRRVGLAVAAFQHEDAPTAEALEARLREYLRLSRVDAVADGRLIDLPVAPSFSAERLDEGDRFRLDDRKGRPVVMMFFLSGCPHCQDALRFFKAELARLPEKTRPLFAGIATDTRPYVVEPALREKKLDFFPVLLDRTRDIATAYGAFAVTPDIVLIDASGRIAYRRTGWSEKYDPDVMRMHLARLTGSPVPMLLARDGYSGSDACAVCHVAEAATWGFTSHAFAFDTLVTRGSDRDPKCVGCHVVGFGERGGYSEAGREKYLENVGCETCHGRGGGHLDGAKAGKGAPKGDAKDAAGQPVAGAAKDYSAACARCHDEEHSLGFDYATFVPRVSHAAIAALGDDARARLVAERDRPRDLLPKAAAYVGSDACRSCHQREYGVWAKSAHARSVDSLERKDKERDQACVRCHVTGYGRPGGFPEGAKVGAHEDLARVGCESCHGPGGDHIRDGGKRPAGIVRLGDKCDSCVILQICGSCHDDANDPDFRFHVEQRIEAQRHGAAAPASRSKP